MTRAIALLALVLAGAALFFALDLWLDDRFVRRFLQQEQMTVRPTPRYRPTPHTPYRAGAPDWMAG